MERFPAAGCLGVLAPPPLGHVDSASRRGVTGLGVARERTVREERERARLLLLLLLHNQEITYCCCGCCCCCYCIITRSPIAVAVAVAVAIAIAESRDHLLTLRASGERGLSRFLVLHALYMFVRARENAYEVK